MKDETRERLERICRMCEEMGAEGEQLLLIRLEDVKECLKADRMLREVMPEYGKEENRGEEQSADQSH